MSEIKYIKKRTTRNAIEALRPDASDYDTDEEYSAAWDMWADCCTVIDGATPADVAPVVHGHWVQVIYSTGIEAHECSVCGGETLCNDFGAEQLSDYCPHCGAKMDESEDSNEDT